MQPPRFIGILERKIPAVSVAVFCLIVPAWPLSSVGAETGAGVATNQAPVAIDVDGATNAYKVSDILYRGDQPSAKGMKKLKGMGIKTVISLRKNYSDKEVLGDSGLQLEEIFDTWEPKEEHAVKFLQIITDTNKTPVFVHCQNGVYRTGILCTIYRIAVCGWSKDDAIKEMLEIGHGLPDRFQNLVEFIRALDVEAVKAKVKVGKKEGNKTE